MGLFDFIFSNKRERQELLRLQQEIEGQRQKLLRLKQEESKRKEEETQRQAESHRKEKERKRQQQVELQYDLLSNFDFNSNCHQRYENDNPVMGLQICPRFIKIRKNINGCSGYQLKNGDGYILTATNGDTGIPQFAPKPMRVVKCTDSEILLKGYRVSAQSPFGWQEIDLSDYGFSIKLKNGKPDKCILHMYDRNTMLEYMILNIHPDAHISSIKEMTETEKFVIEAMQQLQLGNDGDATYHPLYKAWCSYRRNPEQLKDIQDFGRYGMGLSVFLSYETVTDIDDQQQLATLSYLFLSKAINQHPTDFNLYKNRILLMLTNHEPFKYTVSSVVEEKSGFDFMMGLSNLEARDSIYKMEFADLSTSPNLLSINMFATKYRDLKSKIASNFFGPNQTTASIIAKGKELHKEVLAYLENKVIKNCDIDF